VGVLGGEGGYVEGVGETSVKMKEGERGGGGEGEMREWATWGERPASWEGEG
jgi:hypothetical protein